MIPEASPVLPMSVEHGYQFSMEKNEPQRVW